jgi:Mg-chelatase subunit ChlD
MLSAANCGAGEPGAANSPPASGAQLQLFEKPSGEKFFALSLTPSPETLRTAAPAKQGIDVEVLFDTSASQTGPYRTDAIAALKSLLASLAPTDRVKLTAVDLRPVALTQGLVAPTGPEMKAALERLNQREPLGSTDMGAALRAAADTFANATDRPHAAIYVGDGMSKANFLNSSEFASLTADLVNARTPIHSYVIGPARDMQLLAALANHTGGMVYVDSADANVAQQAGAALAQVVHVPVLWPTEMVLPPSFKETYPKRTPPLRLDRDTVLVGVFEGQGLQSVIVRGVANGASAEAKWTVSPEKSADDLAFLPQLLEAVRADEGATLPTLGSEGLREVGRIMLARADGLTKMGARELASGNLLGAQKLAEAARRTDPNHPQAAALEKAVQKAAEDPDLRLKQSPAPPQRSPQGERRASAP